MKNMAEGMPRLRDRAKMTIRRIQEKMKNAYDKTKLQNKR